MSTTHLDRKELKRPDAFLERVSSAFKLISENSGAFLGLLAVLFAIGLGVAFYSNLREHKAMEANSALFSAKKSLAATLEKQPKESKDWQSAAKADLDKIEQLARDFKGTRPSFDAYLLLGDTYLERGDSAKAIEYYRQAAETGRPKSVRAAAQHAMAYAYENSKQYDAAVDALQQIIRSGDKSLKGDAMLALARNYELKGDKAKAIEQYDLISKEFTGSALAKTADLNKSQLR